MYCTCTCTCHTPCHPYTVYKNYITFSLLYHFHHLGDDHIEFQEEDHPLDTTTEGDALQKDNQL